MLDAAKKLIEGLCEATSSGILKWSSPAEEIYRCDIASSIIELKFGQNEDNQDLLGFSVSDKGENLYSVHRTKDSGDDYSLICQLYNIVKAVLNSNVTGATTNM